MRWKVSLRIQYGRRSHLVSLAVLGGAVVAFLGFLAWGQTDVTASVQSPNSVQAPETVAVSRRQYYLTENTQFDGNEALTACAEGYHMASIWEILGLSNLRYNVNLGRTQEDSGFGPPTFFEGWVRTGYGSDTGNTPGQGNCAIWSSDSGTAYGTSVYLPSDWKTTTPDLHVWKASVWQCNTQMPVWCVADEVDGVGTCSIPQPITCGQQVNGNTTGRANNIDDYDCVGWNESGPEVIYSLDLPTTFAPYTVTATLGDLSVDLDVFLLSTAGCYAGNCVGVTSSPDGDTATATGVTGGTYYIAVDGYWGAAGGYTLNVDCDLRQVYLPLVLRNYP